MKKASRVSGEIRTLYQTHLTHRNAFEQYHAQTERTECHFIEKQEKQYIAKICARQSAK